MEQFFISLFEEFIEFIYENEEDITVYKKSHEKSVQKLPLNFIQLIKESGFTPPVFV